MFGVLGAIPAGAQSTQGVLLGQVNDSITGLAVQSARIECVSTETGLTFTAAVGQFGFYAVTALSPGTYSVTITANDYQAQQARQVEIAVASRVELNFRLRPLSDLWEAGRFGTWHLPGSQQTLTLYGPDVDTSRLAVFSLNNASSSPLETSRSDVIGRIAIDNVPLTGRDVYTMLLLLPGVTADTGTARGQGFSTLGQRPSASEYLLDGAYNNNSLVTGPLNTAAPEFIQEYRVSTGNYAAEYGRTSGFVANAVTRSGGAVWHGAVFFHLENWRLNANGFQENASGFPRSPTTQVEGGFTAGGPLIPHKLFLSLGLDQLRTKSLADPVLYALPTTAFIQSTNPTGIAGALLRQFPSPDSPSSDGNAATVSIAPPADFSRSDVYARLDYEPSAADRLFAHFLRDSLKQPDYLFSPYPGFSTPYHQTSLSLAAAWRHQFGSSLGNELRGARSGDSIRFNAPNSDTPQLILSSGSDLTVDGRSYPIIMPGPQNPYNYRNRGATWEIGDTLTVATGRHLWKAGGGLLQRNIDLNLAFASGGSLLFNSFGDVSQSVPLQLQVEVDRYASGFTPVQPNRSYRYRQGYAFAQDSFRIGSRLTLDYGIRYESYGSPVNTGETKDTLIVLGSGSGGIQGAIAGAKAVTPASIGDQTLFPAGGLNLAPRVGVAWDIPGSGSTILRASYGLFYDRPFDNLWENAIQNRYETAAFQNFNASVPAGASTAEIQAAGQYQSSSQIVNGLVFQPRFRAPRVQNAFIGLERPLHRRIYIEGAALASTGHGLVTTDIINRPFSVPATDENPPGYLNPGFSLLDYRANQGSSRYAALTGSVKFRLQQLFAQVSYTWSHSQDNQSEPLGNSFFDLNQFSQQPGTHEISSAFTTQFDSSGDWAKSDFDQRQNLVMYFVWTPAIQHREGWVNRALRDWRISGLSAIRSGLPYSVYATQQTGRMTEYIINERADLVNPVNAKISAPGPGGRYLLNLASFSNPAAVVGNTGRNAFTGPGLFSADLSLARVFPLPFVREQARLILRADAYNVLNHANLNNPDSFWFPGSTTFGLALAGRAESASGFPLLAPLRESARIIQIMARLEF